MKKFLLLLVGVLFALSAKADWTFYADISGTGWGDVAPYLYLGKNEWEKQHYYSRIQGVKVSDNVYKFTVDGWTGLECMMFSKTYLEVKADHDDNSFLWSDQFKYGDGDDYIGALQINSDSPNWKIVDNTLYTISKGNTVYARKYNIEVSSVSVRMSSNWKSDIPLTKQADGKYTVELNSKIQGTSSLQFKLIIDGSWTGSSQSITSAGQAITLANKGSGDNITISCDLESPKFVFDPIAWTISIVENAVTPDPKPVVKTAYTIYFDTFQSGWRKVTLLNDGVEVVGSLVKTGYIHGAKEDGVEGYLHKYTVNTTDASKLTFTNGTASYTLRTITDGNVYYVSESGLADAALESYKVNAAASYRLHGQIVNGSWDTYKMTYFDGLWIYEADNFVAGNFGIKKLRKDEAVDKSETSTNPWIYAKTMTENAHYVVIGAATNCALQGSDQATEKSGNFYSSVTGKKTLVFDPEAMTIMFINPVAAKATVNVEPVSTTSHANKLSVTIKVSDYSSVTGGYDLSNGTFTATVSTDGNFTNVPYASNYTLTVGSTSMPINITMPAEPTFDIKATNATVFAPAAGQNKGILSVAFTVETTWAYNLPHVICTCDGVVVPGNVEWSTNGFTFSAAEAVPLNGTDIADDMTFKFVITPEYPFMVNAASPRGQMRVAGTGYQTVLGTAITDAEAKLTRGEDKVSGVEGVVIEAEDAPVEYYNLQGQRVNGDLAPGIYIRRQGTTVTKVRI